MKKWIVLCLLFMPVMATAAITECLGPNEELYFTSDSSCPDGYTNTTPAHKTVKKDILKKSGPLVFDLQLGMTFDEVEEIYPKANLGEKTFSVSVYPSGLLRLNYISGRLIKEQLVNLRAHFASDAYLILRMQLIKKYGEPSFTHSSVIQNRMGAKFQDETRSWTFDSGIELEINKYTSNLDESSVSLSSPVYFDYLKKNTPKLKIEGF